MLKIYDCTFVRSIYLHVGLCSRQFVVVHTGAEYEVKCKLIFFSIWYSFRCIENEMFYDFGRIVFDAINVDQA